MGSELKVRESSAHLKKDEPLFLHEMQEMNNESHPVAGRPERTSIVKPVFDLGYTTVSTGALLRTFPWGAILLIGEFASRIKDFLLLSP